MPQRKPVDIGAARLRLRPGTEISSGRGEHWHVDLDGQAVEAGVTSAVPGDPGSVRFIGGTWANGLVTVERIDGIPLDCPRCIAVLDRSHG